MIYQALFMLALFSRRYASCVGIRSDMILQRPIGLLNGVGSLGQSGIPTVGIPTQPSERRGTARALRRDESTEKEPLITKRDYPPTESTRGTGCKALRRRTGKRRGRRSNTSSSFRRVSLPPDMPDPQEVGLPPRSSGKSVQKEAKMEGNQETESVSLRKSAAQKKWKERKSLHSRFGILGF